MLYFPIEQRWYFTCRHGSDENALRGSEALTLDAIRSGVRFQRSIAEAWIKVSQSILYDYSCSCCIKKRRKISLYANTQLKL